LELFGVGGLAQYGLSEDDLPVVAEAAAKASSTKGNPVTPSPDDLIGILRAAL